MLRKEFIDPCAISQRQLAEASSLDAGTLSRMINGGVNITVQTRRRHARKILNGLLTLGCLQSCEQAKALLRTISADDFLHEEDEEDAKLIASLKVLVDRAKLPAPPIYQTVYSTPLFGRDHDIAAICAKLRDADVRLLTLVGPAGVGKTELARQAELQCLQDFSNEPILVRLEALDDANLVMPTIARGLGLGEVGTRSSLDHLIEYLRDQHQLIILDNFEHVMEAREELVRLLMACPHLKVLVTSLEKLNVRIEHVVDVYPLAVPDPGSVSASEDLLRYPGTQLFLDRAKASRYDIDPSSKTARIIAEICKSLDGLPAAIILAAPHIKEYLPKELLQEVRERLLQTLTGGAVDMPERHRTLEALLAYSYDQLDTQEQRLFRRLSVFAGGLTFDAAEAVCNIPGEEPLQVRKLVTSLIHRNLMVRRKARGNGAGFEVLRTYRLYGYDKLEQAEEAEIINRQHRDFFLQMAEASQAKLRGPEQVLWQGLLESELDNIRAALHWCSAKNDIETGLRLAGDLLWFCYLNGYWREGRQWLETFLKHPEALDCTAIRAKALYAAGFLAFYRGDYRDAVDYLEQSIDLFRALGDKEGVAFAQVSYAMSCYGRAEDIIDMRSMLQGSAELLGKTGNEWGRAWALIFLGYAVNRQGNHKEARSIFEESQKLFEHVGEKHGVAWSFLNQGDIAWFEGHYDEAEDLYKQSLKGHEEVHDVQGAAWARGSLGHVMLYKGDYKQAALYLNKCLETSRKLADRLGIYGCLIGIAELLRRVGKLEQATCLLGAAQALCKDFSKNQILQLRPTITDYATIKDELLRQYGEVLFGEAEGEGRAMSLNGALKYAQTQTAKTCWINPHSTPT